MTYAKIRQNYSKKIYQVIMSNSKKKWISLNAKSSSTLLCYRIARMETTMLAQPRELC